MKNRKVKIVKRSKIERDTCPSCGVKYIDHLGLKTDAFIKDILKVYNKHQISLSHEDSHGAFIIEKWSEENKNKLLFARIQ